MTMILNCQLCGGRFYANTEHICPTTDSRIIELLEKILDRMPEPEKTHPCPGCGTFTDKRVCNSCWGTSDDPEAGYSQVEFIEDKPAPSDDLPGEPVEPCGRDVGDATYCPCLLPRSHDGLHSCKHTDPTPADDLPGEPVEPGDLRAGDRVEYDFEGLRSAGTLVTVHGGSFLRSDAPDSDGFCPDVVSQGCRWAGGITDVRLIERAPREDEAPDEDGRDKWELRYRKAIGERNRATRERDEQCARAEKAEAEVKHLRGRLDAFRADVARYESDMGYVSAYNKVQLLAVKNELVSILARERARQEGN